MKKWLPDEIVLREKAPLFEALSAYADAMHTSFHMPGSRPGVPAFSQLDVTELPQTDDLNEPQGPVLEAQRAAAQYFGAAETRFLTGGSSEGIFAALLCLAGPGGAILLPRPVHRAFMYAAQRFALDVFFAKPTKKEAETAFSPLTYPSIDDYESALQKHPEIRVVVATAPDYYGYICDLGALENLCQKYEKKLLIDAAHGAHLQLLPEWRLYGDMVLTSAHKTLPSLTPAAYLHICEQEDEQAVQALAKRVDYTLKVLRTSSPPLFVAASADWARAFLKERGFNALQRQKKSLIWLRTELPEQIIVRAPITEEEAQAARSRMSSGTQVLRPRVFCDPLRLVLDVSYYMRGTEMQTQLSEMGVDCEFADARHVVFIPSLLSEPTDYMHLSAALAAVCANCTPLSEADRIVLCEESERLYSGLSGLTSTQDKATREVDAEFLSGRLLNAALLRTLAGQAAPEDEAVIPYPPGIPLYWPGELR